MNEISLIIGILGTVIGIVGGLFGYYSLFITSHGINKTKKIANEKNTFTLNILKNLLSQINSITVDDEKKKEVENTKIAGRFIVSESVRERIIEITVCPVMTLGFYKLLYIGITISIMALPYYPIIKYFPHDEGGLLRVLFFILISILSLILIAVVKYLFGQALFTPASITFKRGFIYISPLDSAALGSEKYAKGISLEEDIKFIAVESEMLFPILKGRKMTGLGFTIDDAIFNITLAPLFISKNLECVNLKSVANSLNKEIEVARKDYID